ncbi:unnamed protein product [Ilex paraguariensis]|uniref:TF-B3 domain-containing protein n=1 Tax=Ilex paraguariensis TaxID=185542 RepID=A0ABC8T1L2_9AQUA
MSINHFSSDLPEAMWRTQKQPMMIQTPESPPSKHKAFLSQPIWSNPQLYHAVPTTASAMFGGQNTSLSFNLNREDEELEEQLTDDRETITQEKQEDQYQTQEIPKQAMFEKPLTPSDVGKLNRLVIPKQYAEKFFPLSGGDSGEKGLLLSFEDESDKTWRFRYSYWNSSQSYVLTKGWSRFVKEKRLDAGDIVVFESAREDKNRLFIGWRKRTATVSGVAQPGMVVAAGGGGSGWTRVFYSGHPYPSEPNGPSLPYQPDCRHAGSVVHNHKTPSGNSKRLRLFGVNLECQADDSDSPTPENSSMSSQGQAHFQYYNPTAHGSNHHNQKDINFPEDVNQMRYHRG